MAAGIGPGLPQQPFRVGGLQLDRVGFDRADIGQPKLLDQGVAIAQRLPEQLAGIQEDDRNTGIDLRREGQEDGGLGTEGRNQRDFPVKLPLHYRAQEITAGKPVIAGLKG